MLGKLDWYVSLQSSRMTKELLLMQVKGYSSCLTFLPGDQEIADSLQKTLNIVENSELELTNTDYQNLLSMYLPVIALIEDEEIKNKANQLITDLGLQYTKNALPEDVD